MVRQGRSCRLSFLKGPGRLPLAEVAVADKSAIVLGKSACTFPSYATFCCHHAASLFAMCSCVLAFGWASPRGPQARLHPDSQ
eukprot:scaffold66079_cov60-Phaeocystis_antarctica.AAC.8